MLFVYFQKNQIRKFKSYFFGYVFVVRGLCDNHTAICNRSDSHHITGLQTDAGATSAAISGNGHSCIE